MDHRKRNMLQHKVEIPTLLQIAIATNKIRKLNSKENHDENVSRTLAVKAIESLKNCDHAAAKIGKEEMVWIC
jgi:hypothetical protein